MTYRVRCARCLALQVLPAIHACRECCRLNGIKWPMADRREQMTTEDQTLRPEDNPDYESFMKIAMDTGKLVAQKNLAYGNSFHKSGEFLKLLYPDGITPDRYQDALALVRDFDKSMRIANHKNAFGESPWRDKVGYGILGVHYSETAEANRCQTGIR